MSVRRPIDVSQADQVASALTAYLSSRLGARELALAGQPEQLAGGTDAYVYAFRLRRNDGIGPPWSAPLVVRAFRRQEDAARAERETSVQRFAAERGYRTPAILAFERDGADFGVPFAIMPKAPGVTLLQRFERNPLRLLPLVRTLAAAHVALHRLPLAGCPIASNGCLVDRRLQALASSIDEYGVTDARPAYAWLDERRGTVIAEERSLCHNDFHPLNIIVDDRAGPLVIDWSRADIGDRLHDVARTYVVMSLAQGGGRDVRERVVLLVSRFAATRYLAAYQRLLPVATRRFYYWQSLLTLQSWVETAPMMAHGAEAVGARADASAGYRTDIVDKIRAEFWRSAGRFERLA